MKRRISLLATAASLLVAFAVVTPASAHNRALVWLPTGECVQVGSLKSVILPDGTFLDLRPETAPDEIGTAYAAHEGNSALELGQCPD